MTTIAYRAGVIAADSLISQDDCALGDSTKVVRLENGCLFGAAGDADTRNIEVRLGALRSPKRMPLGSSLTRHKVDFHGILVWPTGEAFHLMVSEPEGKRGWTGSVFAIDRPYHAIGSGAAYALGAMAAGKGAVEAVKIACQFDLKSRPPVQELHYVKWKSHHQS